MTSNIRYTVAGLFVAAACAAGAVSLNAQQTTCDRTQTAWCPGDVMVGAGITADQLYPKGSQPKQCADGPGLYPDPDPISGSSPTTYDCAARVNAGTYFQYDQYGNPVGTNGTPTAVLDALAAGLTPVDAQTQQPASVTSWDILTNTMTAGEHSWWTTGCAQAPPGSPDPGALWTTGFWSNVISRVPDGAASASQGLDLGSLTRVSNGIGGPYGGFQTGGPESIVFDHSGNMYVGTIDGSNQIIKFDPTGTQVLDTYTVPSAGTAQELYRGADWLELSVDDTTMFYTSESNVIVVFRTDRQPIANSMVAIRDQNGAQIGTQSIMQAGVLPLTDSSVDPTGTLFGKIVLTNPGTGPIGNSAYALRLLPPGDGSGGILVAVDYDVWRTDLTGTKVRDYIPGYLQNRHFFALDITPDGQYFWTATLPIANEFGYLMNDPVNAPSQLFKYHIASGQQVLPTLTPSGASVFGLCVVKEYTAGGTQPLCTSTSTDPLCQPLPNCTPGSTDPQCVPNTAPTIAPIPDQTTYEAATVTIPIVASDGSGTGLHYTTTVLPQGVSLTATTASATTTPASNVAMAGTLSYTAADVWPNGATRPVTVTVTDGLGLSASTTFNWTVINVDAPPTLNSVTPSSTLTVPHNVPLVQPVTISTSDVDSCQHPSVQWVGQDLGLTVTPPNVICGTSYITTISGTPNANAALLAANGNVYPASGITVPVTVDINDNFGQILPIPMTWTLTNAAPVFVSVPSAQTMHAGTPLPANFAVTTSDANNDPVSVTATGVPHGVTATQTTNGLAFTGAPDTPGTYTTSVTADDHLGGTAQTTISWTITDAAPVVTSPGPIYMPPGTPVSMQIAAADADDATSTLTFTAIGLPDGLQISSHGLITGTVTTQNTYTVTVTAADPWQRSGSATFTWTVAYNRPPDCSLAAATPNLLWPPDHKFATIGIRGIADPDGDPVSIAVTSIFQDEPTLVLGSGNTAIDGEIAGATALVRAERSGLYNGRVYLIGFTASDGRGGVCTGTVTVGVPHDQGQQDVPIDSGLRYDSTVPGVPRVR